jgi:hypothetical protein
MHRFATIASIDVGYDDSWRERLFLTFDIDWAHDDILADTIDLVETADVAATWFVTHDTPLLARLRANPKFELGIHPNFNFLLQGAFLNGGCADDVVDRLLEIVPEAKSVRCHSVLQSSKLMQLFQEKGLTSDVNHFIPEQSRIELKPWRLWNGLIKVPYFWEDDAAFIYKNCSPANELIERPGIKVFDFHPVHVYLNTESLDRYERTGPLHRNPKELIQHRYQGYGTRNQLLELLALATDS